MLREKTDMDRLFWLRKLENVHSMKNMMVENDIIMNNNKNNKDNTRFTSMIKGVKISLFIPYRASKLIKLEAILSWCSDCY